MKPWLLIDVDEVLNVWPHALRPDGDWQGHTVLNERDVAYTLHLNPVHGEWLNGLADVYDLAWGTTWWRVANKRISPLLGLPTTLPSVPLPNPEMAPWRISWKTPHVRRWANGRALAWIDDDITASDAEALTRLDVDGDMWLGGTPPVPDALAVNIPLRIGLTWQHVVQLRDWAESR